ncbi:hypothetical protein [Lysobacter claricitrinus]|uniref:hypothetical protein n=1 Tax=Lysobacter claricitrinus TaxID=3367728 RepID=UPI0037DB4206
MAALTLGFTGMDASTESELRRAFEQALPASGGGWQLVPDTHADYVVVDMDSMYGPMSWLRLHNAGKQVVGLTASPRTQAPYRLGRPVDANALTDLLRDIRVANGVEAVATAPAVAAPAPTPAAPAAVEHVAAKPSGMTPSPQQADQLPEERPAPSPAAELPANPVAITEPAAPANEPPSVAVAQVMPPAPSIEPVAPAPAAAAPAPAPAPPVATRSAEPRSLAEWLASGRLRGRVRFADSSSAVLLDTDQRQYFGPSALKPVTPLFTRDAALADFETVSPDVWNAQTTALGAPQPIARLIWYGALLAGEGRIAPGYDPADRFSLTKWPQTEREFPKHFRIATAMMKGPATVTEIAEASSVPAADVADFINASLATGFAEPFREPEPEPDAGARGGLFGRLRGR